MKHFMKPLSAGRRKVRTATAGVLTFIVLAELVTSPAVWAQAQTPTPSATGSLTPGSPTPTESPGSTRGPTSAVDTHGTLLLWLTVGGIIAAGLVIIAGRKWLKSGQDDQATSLIRSWIAISLVLGLLLFCAAILLTENTTLQSVLFGGLVASTGAAVAFYFSSKAADQARADILNAATGMGAATRPTAFSKIDPPVGQVGKDYEYRIEANGSPKPTYWKGSGDLPVGLVLDGDGTLHGKPTQADDYKFTIVATNSAGPLVSQELTVKINP